MRRLLTSKREPSGLRECVRERTGNCSGPQRPLRLDLDDVRVAVRIGVETALHAIKAQGGRRQGSRRHGVDVVGGKGAEGTDGALGGEEKENKEGRR